MRNAYIRINVAQLGDINSLTAFASRFTERKLNPTPDIGSQCNISDIVGLKNIPAEIVVRLPLGNIAEKFVSEFSYAIVKCPNNQIWDEINRVEAHLHTIPYDCEIAAAYRKMVMQLRSIG